MESRERARRESNAPTYETGFTGVSLTVFILLFVGALVLGSGGFALFHVITGGKIASGAATQESVAAQQEGAQTDSSSGTAEQRIEALLADLTLEQKVGQLFVIPPESLTDVEQQTAAGEATREAISKCPVGGFSFTSTNFVDEKQTTEMLRNMQNYTKDACGLPLFTCVAEEGGLASPVGTSSAFSLKETSGAAELGKEEDVEKARDTAITIAGYLSDLGFNLTFAPVADILDKGSDTDLSKQLAERSFGSDAELVSNMVTAQIDGFTHEGMLCAVKNFPGIGAAEEDTHNEMLYSHKTMDELKSHELVPFEAAVSAKVPLIMVGNITCVEAARLDGSLPASLNPTFVNELLRNTMGYDGVVITSSLKEGSVEDVCKAADQGVKALQAGVDLIYDPSDFEDAYKGVLSAVESGDISEDRIDESLRRIIRLKLAL